MTFITESDYKQMIHEADLEDIIDLDPSIRMNAEQTAVSIATDHLSSRFDTVNVFNKTGSERHPSVVWAVCSISLHQLRQRTHPHAIPDHAVDQYNRAMKWLKGVQDGTVNPVGLPVPEDTSKDYILYGGETKRQNRI